MNVLAYFFIVWVASAAFGFYKKSSITISIGGGLIAAFLALLPVLLFTDNGGNVVNEPAQIQSQPPVVKKPKVLTAYEKRENKIKAQFSVWDGSHRNLEQLIKKLMNDPDSYEHIETRYADNGDYLVVKTTYRGKNAFGGKVVNWVKAKVSLDGKILSVLDTFPK